MKRVIIGTAGHVDHGKTALIRALTGIDTDRLEEEKKRGITIELGYAHMEFDDGTHAGIIDVPGHEKFIRNMLAGAGGIDLAMLIVAADEGIMPQTVEHMEILSLLEIRTGLVVVTKTDLVDQEWLDVIIEDIGSFTKGTFLEGQPVVPVSAYTGEGIEALKQHLYSLIGTVREKKTNIPFRMPIDRVFAIDGFGTIVTGTLIEGAIRIGDRTELLTPGIPAVVRSIQVHGKSVEIANAGQRVALNLVGIKKNDIRKGDVIAKPNTVRSSAILDVRIKAIRSANRNIENASLLHLYHGTRVVMAKVILLDRDELLPGDSCYAQLRLSEKLASKTGDRFVVRFYSPMETIGGGVILNPSPPKRSRKDDAALKSIQIRENGSAEQQIYFALSEMGFAPTADILRLELNMEETEFSAGLETLLKSGEVLEILACRYLTTDSMRKIVAKCREILDEYHKLFPLQQGLNSAQLRQKLFGDEELTVGNAILEKLAHDNIIRIAPNGRVALSDFKVSLSKRQQALKYLILQQYREAGYEALTIEEALSRVPQSEKRDADHVIESLLQEGELVKLSPKVLWERGVFNEAIRIAEEHFKNNEVLTMPQFRDMLGTSRKYALAFLEYLDRNGITKKVGDNRVLFKGFGLHSKS